MNRHPTIAGDRRYLAGIFFGALAIVGPVAYITAAGDNFDPHPAPNDLVLPMPNGARMVFRPVFLGVGDKFLAERQYEMGDNSWENFREQPTQVFVGGSFVRENGGRRDWMFYLGKYEVTRTQYEAVGGQTGDNGRTPRTGLTRVEVEDFITAYNLWLRKHAPSALPEQDGSPGFLRLPSEEEWEFAARGGVAVNEVRFKKATPYNDALLKHEWFGGSNSSFGKVKEIGLLAPNALQIYDLLGNVAEMTSSPYRLEYGRGRIGGFTVRGGSFETAAGEIRTSLRTEQLLVGADGRAPRDESVGFRLVIGSAVFANLASSRALEAAVAGWQKNNTRAVPMDLEPSAPAPAATGPSATDWVVNRVDGRDCLLMDNIAEFYRLSPVRREEKEASASSGVRSIRASVDSQDFFINNLKFILSYPAIEHEGKVCISRMDLVKLIEPVMRPSRIRNAEAIDTVVLDAGHGGLDNGSMSTYGPEKDFALDVVLRAKTLLEAAGLKVLLTRNDDTFISVEKRVAVANQHKRAVFIAVQFSSGASDTGVESFTLAPRGVPSTIAEGPSVSDLDECPGNARDAENIALATAMHAALVVKTRMFDNGLKRARFVVIRDITIPGVLVTAGFQTNPDDAKMIATPGYRQLLAQAILQAVENYRRAVGSQRAPAAPRSAEETKTGN